MENCEKALDLLNQYIDGELNESDAEFVRAHLENCEACKKAYTELLEIEKLFDEATKEAPDGLCQSITEKIKAEKSLIAKRKKFTKIFGSVAIAAAISLTVLASPAILLIASGGAKAECEDRAEALAPEDNFNKYYDAGMPERVEVATDKAYYDEICDDATDIDAVVILLGDIQVELGKKYTANMLDKTSSPIAFELRQDGFYALFQGKSYTFQATNGILYLSGENEALAFEINKENGVCFNQVGESND